MRRPDARALLPFAVVLVGLAVAAALIATGPDVEPRPPEVAAPLVRVIPVERRDVQFRVRAHGTVAPRTESELVPEVSGPVVWMSPALVSGGFFEQGEPLLRIDPRDYEVALEQARARLARAQSENRRAERELVRQRGLAQRDFTSAARLDSAENDAQVAEAALREARAGLDRAGLDLERTEVRAPYEGRVREERVDVGQFVNRGSAVAKLYAVDYAEVRLPVPDDELAYLTLPLVYRGESEEEGPEVVLRARFAGDEHEWRGRVVRTEGELDPKSRMVHVVARVSDPYGREGTRPPLSVGLFVQADILGERVEDVVVLPRSALRGGRQVLVVDDEGLLRFREVEVLRVAREEAVIGAGLREGERVCVSPLETAVDGMRVRIADGAALPAVAAGSEGPS